MRVRTVSFCAFLMIVCSLLPGVASGAASRTFTVVLAPSDPAALRALALRPGRAPRAQLSRVLPSTARFASVEAALGSQGFSIVRTTPWTVVARGTDAALAATFGARNGSLYERVPRSLAASVAGVVADDGGPAVHPAFSGYSGSGLRSKYLSSATVVAGTHRTIGTLQFSGWDSSDLTTYASQIGMSDPVASGQFTPVAVDGADPTQPDGEGGDVEVALDQETLLGLAPDAAQRAYFAPNTDQGEIDALQKIASDAQDPSLHLVALSISWGACEPETGDSLLNAMEPILENIVANGVTVFAASGDSGAYDCGDQRLAVDFPASSPVVVGVGGTTLPSTGAEIAWSDQGGDGSGGGQSTVFEQPSYQTGRTPSAGTRLNAPMRLVPDVAADADPATGFRIVSGGTSMVVGGTSLASPLVAAMFTNMLGARGYERGYGDIHTNLYTGAATNFRDITSGDNLYYTAQTGYDMATGLGAPLWSHLRAAIIGDPSLRSSSTSRSRTVKVSVPIPAGMSYTGWKAGSGSQAPPCNTSGQAPSAPVSITVGSDGSVTLWVSAMDVAGYCHTSHKVVFVDTQAPTAYVAGNHSGDTVGFSWRSSDPSPSSGGLHYSVTIKRAGTTTVIWHSTSTTSTSYSFTGVSGVTYTASVVAIDKAGNRSAAKTATVTV